MSSSVGRSGGIYIPPFKLARLQHTSKDDNGEECQRAAWERLRKSIKGLVNRVNTSNIQQVVQELLVENLLLGRGLFVRSVMHAQIASPVFSNVFAALVAVVNSKIPEIGDILLRRLALQFRRAYSRSDEIVLSAICKFTAHLYNQHVISEFVILQIVTIFLEKLSSDSVKICCQMLFECGDVLNSSSPKAIYLVFERLRQILQEGRIDKRVQYVIESIFEARRKKFAEYPGIFPELDLVEEDDQITHEVDVIEGELVGEESLNIFQPMDPEQYAAQAAKWNEISSDLLGTGEGEDEYESGGDEEETAAAPAAVSVRIADMTEQDLINLRKTIYLAIMSSANFEECVHKILRLNIRSGQEKEVVNMLIDCAAMEKTSSRFFHLQSERLCRLARAYRFFFEEAFAEQYEQMHRHETGKIRNIAQLFAHLLHTDAIGWTVFASVTLSEEETTSSTRIFLKILFQDLAENMGIPALSERIKADAAPMEGIFPTTPSLSNAVAMRFSVNFFTAIGLGGLTSDIRERLNELTASAVKKDQLEEPVLRAPAPREMSPDRKSESSVDSFGRKRRRSHSRDRRDHRADHGRGERRSRSPDGGHRRSYRDSHREGTRDRR